MFFTRIKKNYMTFLGMTLIAGVFTIACDDPAIAYSVGRQLGNVASGAELCRRCDGSSMLIDTRTGDKYWCPDCNGTGKKEPQPEPKP